MSSCTAIIPARGGSRRLPRKNIYPLFDKPLIAWSIEAALGATSVDDVYVSTEDSEVESVAAAWGARVIKRPTTLSDDITPKMEAIRHAYTVLDDLGERPEIIVSLQANSPELRSSDIDRGVQLLRNRKLWEVFSVDQDGVQNAAIRVLHSDCLFNQFLSAHIGVIQTTNLDVHTLEDINLLEQRYQDAHQLRNHAQT